MYYAIILIGGDKRCHLSKWTSEAHPINKVRFAWWGAEELGILGSQYYIQHLSQTDLARIGFYMDIENPATPNYSIFTYTLSLAPNAGSFPATAITRSSLGSTQYKAYYDQIGQPTFEFMTKPGAFTLGSDYLHFLSAGIPVSESFTGQDSIVLKSQAEVDLFGGSLGAYESCDGVAYLHCDNLSNVNLIPFELTSKATAAVTARLANTLNLNSDNPVYVDPDAP